MIRATLAVSAGLLLTAACTPREGFVVEAARVVGPVPGTRVAAGYLEITNYGPDTRLIGASSPAAEHIEFHTTRNDDGIMRMRKLAAIDLPGGRSIRLEPGGSHLMLFGVGALGDTVEIKLITEREPVTVEFRTISGGDL